MIRVLSRYARITLWTVHAAPVILALTPAYVRIDLATDGDVKLPQRSDCQLDTFFVNNVYSDNRIDCRLC